MTLRTFPRILLVLALGLAGVACSVSGSGSPGGPPSTLPTPAPTSASPGFSFTLPSSDLQLDVTAFVACLHGGGIEVTPEDSPRFGSSEVQVDVPTTEFGGARVGVFVFANARQAFLARPQLDSELSAAGTQPSVQFGNVVVAGLQDVLNDPQSRDALTVLLGCLV